MRAVVRRSLKDCALPLFADNKFALAYNAARALAAMAVLAAGYRIRANRGAHFNTFVALKAAMGPVVYALADYLDICRRKRNELSYEAADIVSDAEAEELVVKTRELEGLVEGWIAERFPHLR